MSTSWQVPADLAARMITPAQRQWVADLPDLATTLASRWRLRRAGPAWSGFWSAVWPVLDHDGTPLALKISTDGDGREHEAEALRVWDGRGAVHLIAHDPSSTALLLERLDGSRTLADHTDIDAATMIIAELLAELGGQPAWPGLRSLATVAESMLADLARDAPTSPLPERVHAAAVETLHWLHDLPPGQTRLVHGDCHFLNVLPSLPGQPPRWAVIDPLPFAGVAEFEPVAMLRNRFADAAAQGDADRALRRRVDVIAERTGMDAALVRRVSQAVAVQNLPFLLAEHPQHDFVAPYELISRWIED